MIQPTPGVLTFLHWAIVITFVYSGAARLLRGRDGNSRHHRGGIPAQPGPRRGLRVGARVRALDPRHHHRALVQRGADGGARAQVAARPGVPEHRGHRRRRRLDRRDARRDDQGIRSRGAAGVLPELAADQAGAHGLPQPQGSAAHRRVEGERRQGGRAQLRDQLRALPLSAAASTATRCSRRTRC